MDLIEIEKMIAEATVKLEAENARLREELAAKDNTIISCDELLALSRKERDSLREQLAAAQADAARYAFIVSRFWDTDGEFSDAIDLLLAQETYPTKQQIDAAIDAAMKEQS